MFEEKLKMSRKKNLSSKIIVDQYDHLIKNSKLQPNFESFLESPHSPHFNSKDIKYALSKQQSSQSEYSLQNFNENQKQCLKCGEIFSLRLYQSHSKICEDKTTLNTKQEIKNFIKKDEYNFFPTNFNNNHEGKITSARNGHQNKDIYQLKEVKKVELKKSNSKLSIQSHDKNIIKRPSSSTRNKLDIKGHENLKEKILSKLQGNRHKNHQMRQQIPKRGSSHTKNTLSNSKPKSANKNFAGLQNGQNKYNTMNSSINRKNIPHKTMNYEFNRSEILRNTSADQKRKQKNDFLSKATLKEEKKYTLKKKNINTNNSIMAGQSFQREMEKSKGIQHYNMKENSSYLSQSNQMKNKTNQQHEFLKEQIRKQGLFRRESSNSGSKRKFYRENEHQMIEEKPYHHQREVNDEYFFFENHPSTVPSHFLKREDRPYSQYQFEQQNMFEQNSSNIIRNKLGLNKFAQKNKPQQTFKQPQYNRKLPRQSLIIQREKRKENPINQEKQDDKIPHRRINSSRENQDQRNQQNNLNRESRNGQIKRNQPRLDERIQNTHQQRNLQRQHQQPRERPHNPMGNSRNGPQRINRAQNRPEPRITNQRMSSQNEQRQNNHPSRNLLQQGNQREQVNRRREQRRRENSSQNRQTNSGRRQQQGQGNNRRIQQDTLNFISNTLNEQFEVMNEHFNLLNNIFSNFSNIVNVNITASTNSQNPTTFVFRSHGRRRNHNRQNYDDNDESSSSNSEYSDFISDFTEDESLENQTDYSEDEYYYEEQENENSGMTQHEINSIPVLRYSKEKHGSNQCTICLVELNETEVFKKLYCDHVFHTECIDEWLKRKNACPVCRDQMGVRY